MILIALGRKLVILGTFRRLRCGVFGIVQRGGQYERRLRVVLFRRRCVKPRLHRCLQQNVANICYKLSL